MKSRYSMILAGGLLTLLIEGTGIAHAQSAPFEEQVASVRSELRAKQGASAQFVDADSLINATKSELAGNESLELRLLNITPQELDDSTAPWEMFAKSLRTLYNNDPNWTGMQVLGLPIPADWDDSVLGNWRKWRVLGDTIPVWTSGYVPTAFQVSKGYEILIDNVAIPQPNPSDQAKAEGARQSYTNEVNKLESMREQVGPHWKYFDAKQQSLPPNRRLSFDQWFRQFDGPKVGQQEIKVNGAAQLFQSYINTAYKGYGWAASLVTDYSNSAFQLPAQSDDGLTLTYRTFNFSPDLGKWIADSKALPVGCSKLTIAYDHTTHHDHSESESWSGGASFGYGIFSFGASASGGRQSVNINDQNFAMSFCARNLAVFTVQPSGWFNGTAVAAFKNGPWVPGGPIANGTIKLYGPDGLFNLMPAQIVVAYKPQVTVSLSAHDYASVKTQFNAGGGFSIGPFGFGGSYHKETSDVKWDDKNNKITAQDNSETPQIVAVVSLRLPDNK